MSVQKFYLGWVGLFIVLMLGRVEAQNSKFGIGVRGGAGRIEGDVKEPVIKPFVSGLFYYSPDPHLSIGIEGGIGEFFTDDDAQSDSVVLAAPVELDLTLRFSPYRRFSPFVTLGAGGVFWLNSLDSTDTRLYADANQDNRALVLKTAGGFDIALSRRFNLSFGGVYRYAFSDVIDLDQSGDEDDQFLTFFGGLTIKLGGGTPDDDRDGVWNRYDLDSSAKEDRDGYMDHDGVPDTRINSDVAAFTTQTNASGVDDIPPIVIHSPILRATAGKDLRIRAEVFENRKLRKAAVLYRPYTFRKWLVAPMIQTSGVFYEVSLPGNRIDKIGLEYCVVAVDDAISGIGYSGLPKRPNFVMVNGSETIWRVFSIVAAIGSWGGASYLVSREQK